MIVIAGVAKIQEGKREEAVQAAVKMADATHQEAGCISYEFYGSLRDPYTFLVFEEWESEEDLAAHFETPHMAEFRAILPSFLVGMSIQQYDVSSVKELE